MEERKSCLNRMISTQRLEVRCSSILNCEYFNQHEMNFLVLVIAMLELDHKNQVQHNDLKETQLKMHQHNNSVVILRPNASYTRLTWANGRGLSIIPFLLSLVHLAQCLKSIQAFCNSWQNSHL